MQGAQDINTETELEQLRELKRLTKSFFDDYLNAVEISDNGVEFNPVHIGCCRVLMTGPLNEVLKQMQELSGAKPKPKMNNLKC